MKKFLFPGIDDNQLKQEDFEASGEMHTIASRVLMKALYGARTCRWELQHAINTLARAVTKWNKNCDIRLHKLVCYINSTLDDSLEGFIGDPIDDLQIICYCDADFASGVKFSKSTSGSYIAIVGPNTFMPIS